MTVVQIALYFGVAGIAGAVGQTLAGYSRSGFLISIALGFIGALLGSWLARVMGLPEVLVIRIGAERFPLIWSILGATLFVVLLGLLTRSASRTLPDRR